MIRLTTRLSASGCVSNNQHRDKDGGEDQVGTSGGKELTYDGCGKAKAVDDHIRERRKEKPNDITQHAPSYSRGYVFILEEVTYRKDQRKADKNGNACEKRNLRITKNIVGGIEEKHIGLSAIQEV